jgi:hypothetical protein
MKKQLVSIVFIVLTTASFAQSVEFDKLELLYSQQHFKLVYRKSNRLLDNPDYDFSLEPSFYRAMSSFRLSQNIRWLNRHREAFEQAVSLFKKVKSTNEGKELIRKHSTEIGEVKNVIIAVLASLKNSPETEFYQWYVLKTKGLFDDLKLNGNFTKGGEENEYSSGKLTERLTIIEIARNQLGIPYVYAGTDQNGFDCSGFTCFVLGKAGKKLPRTASEQFESCVKVARENVEPGDLVFFDNGNGISHVGIIVSKRGEPLEMIHASSSKGIIITEIEKSAYWLKRLSGFGTFFR